MPLYLFGPPNVEKLKHRRDVDGLIKALGAYWPATRRDAALALGDIGDERAVPALILALHDSDSDNRSTAAEALGRLGDAALAALVPFVLRPDPMPEVFVALHRLGDTKVSNSLLVALRQSLSTCPTFEEERLLTRLQTFGGIDGAVDVLIEALGDPDPSVQRCAAELLSVVKHPRAIDSLVAALRPGAAGSSVRREVASTLGRVGDGRAVPRLISVLGDPTEEEVIRREAATALGRLGDPAAVEPVIAVLRDHGEPEALRATAARALGELGDARAVEPLMRTGAEIAISFDDWLAIMDMPLGLPAPRPLQDALSDAWKALAKSPDAHAVQAEHRRLAVDAALRRLQESENPQLRRDAVGELARLEEGRAVEPLCTALGDENAQVRRAAADALGALGDERAVAPLATALADGAWNVRHSAAAALRRIGGPEADRALADLS